MASNILITLLEGSLEMGAKIAENAGASQVRTMLQSMGFYAGATMDAYLEENPAAAIAGLALGTLAAIALGPEIVAGLASAS